MTETELLTAVTSGTKKNPGLCRRLRVRYFHPYDSRRCVPGWPDLVLVGIAGMCFRELKSQSGIVSDQQREWGYALREIGEDWDVWHPHVRPGGAVAFHDARIEQPDGTGSPGPTAVVDELFRSPEPPVGWSLADEVDTLVVVRRAAQASTAA